MWDEKEFLTILNSFADYHGASVLTRLLRNMDVKVQPTEELRLFYDEVFQAPEDIVMAIDFSHMNILGELKSERKEIFRISLKKMDIDDLLRLKFAAMSITSLKDVILPMGRNNELMLQITEVDDDTICLSRLRNEEDVSTYWHLNTIELIHVINEFYYD